MRVGCCLAVLAGLSACAGSDEESLVGQEALANFEIEDGHHVDPNRKNVTLSGPLAEKALTIAVAANPYPGHLQVAADGFTIFRFPLTRELSPAVAPFVCIKRPAPGTTECRIDNEPTILLGAEERLKPQNAERPAFAVKGGDWATFLFRSMETIAMAGIPNQNVASATGPGRYASGDGTFDCTSGAEVRCEVTDFDAPIEPVPARPPGDLILGDWFWQTHHPERHGAFEIEIYGAPAQDTFSRFAGFRSFDSEVVVDGRTIRWAGSDRRQVVCVRKNESTDCRFWTEVIATEIGTESGGKVLQFSGPAATTLYENLGFWLSNRPTMNPPPPIHTGAARLVDRSLACWPANPDVTSPQGPIHHLCQFTFAPVPAALPGE